MKIKGLVVVGLNVGGPGDEQQVPAFAKEFGIQYPLAKPDEDLVSFLLSDSDAIPQTFVFDRRGQTGRTFDRLRTGIGREHRRGCRKCTANFSSLTSRTGPNFEKSKNPNHAWSSFSRAGNRRTTDRSRREWRAHQHVARNSRRESRRHCSRTRCSGQSWTDRSPYSSIFQVQRSAPAN